MLLKVVNFKREVPRRPAELRRLLRYLFTPKASRPGSGARLLAPPQLYRLAMSSAPWGASIERAADQLTAQFVNYRDVACIGRAFPDDWYAHLIVAYSPIARDALAALRQGDDEGRWGTLPRNACGVARVVLGRFGWTPARPSAFIVHGNTRHVHVHVVATIPTIGGADWDILQHSRRRLNAAAKECAERFGLPHQPMQVIV